MKHLPTGIVIKSQATRSQTQNRSIARKLLAEKLDFMEKGSGSRMALKIDAKAKKRADKAKKAKRKYGKHEATRRTEAPSRDVNNVADPDPVRISPEMREKGTT